METIRYLRNEEFATLNGLVPGIDSFDVCIAGGVVRNYIENRNKRYSSDLDIFVSDVPTAKDLRQRLQGFYPETAPPLTYQDKIMDIFSFAVKHPVTFLNSDIDKIQVIYRKMSNPQDAISTFDFTCCQGYIRFGKIAVTEQGLKDISSLALRPTGGGEVYLHRLTKFIERGYLIRDIESFVSVLNNVSKSTVDLLDPCYPLDPKEENDWIAPEILDDCKFLYNSFVLTI